jgi:SPX domain protein involved in polyphosphate accumulation
MERNTEKAVNNLNLRYERKFRTHSFPNIVENMIMLHPSMFKRIYYPRYVNNIYFDDAEMESLYANEMGAFERKKYRIRWYGDLFGDLASPTLEIKRKFGNLGDKQSFELKSFNFNDSITKSKILNIINNSRIPEYIKLKLCCNKPTLLNRYKRKYFISNDKRFRITIDSEIMYYRINIRNNSFIEKYSDDSCTILELKYDKNYENYANSITNSIPFRLTKNSKYVNGLGLINSISM